MFFELSGFLIVTLLLRERERHGAISLGSFYLRRTLRIVPVYYGLLLVLSFVFGVIAPHGAIAGPFWRELPYHFTYTSNWITATTFLSITWSLSAEEQFYLLWPPIERFVKRPLWVLAGLIVFSELMHFGSFDPLLHAAFGVGPDDLTMLRQTTFTPILLGVALAHALHEPRSYEWVSRLCGHRWAAFAYFAVLVVALVLLPGDIRGVPRLTIHLIMLLLLASTVVRTNHALAPLLLSPAVRRIGVLSYGMYLLHMLALHAANTVVGRAHAPMALLFPVTLVLTLVMAEISYRFYETRFLHLKERFAR